MRPPALLFDLDGTLVDSVYYHVLAWKEALDEAGIELPIWRIHRKIGMSGGLLVQALLRETSAKLNGETIEKLQRTHASAYQRFTRFIAPLPGARELLAHLTACRVPWAIATSGRLETAAVALSVLEVPHDVPVITRDAVPFAKPDPDIFLEAAHRLGADASEAVIGGDSVWDLLAARRARAIGVGLLSGGYGQEELERAGAYRVYEDPRDLLRHLDEIGVRAAAP